MALDYKSYREQLAEGGRRDSALTADDQSVVERVLDQLEAHEQSERGLLGDYRYAARLGGDAGVRFLMELILEDEERHHRLMAAMASDVKSSLLWLEGPPALPSVSAAGEERAQLLAQTERFLEVEQDNISQLKDLKKALTRLHSGLLELIVDGMEADTRKHVDILKFIRKQLEPR